MKIRWRTLCLRLVGLLAAAALGFYLLLPSLVQRQIKLALKDKGLADATLDVGVVTHRGLTISGLALADGRLTVPSIHVAYSPGSLRHGRIESATVSSLIVRATLTDDMRLDLGPLAKLLEGDDRAAGPPPFDTLTIRDAELRIAWGDRLLETPIWGSLRRDGDRIVPDLHIDINGGSLESPDGFVHLLGITSDLNLTGLDPVATPAAQRFTITDARLGAWRLGEITIVFQLDGDTLRVDQLSMTSPQLGKLTVQPMTVDLDEPILRLNVTLENLDIAQTLAAVAAKDVSGRGRVDGQLQLRVKPYPPYRMSIDGGSLVASSGATLRFVSRQPLQTVLGVAPTPQPNEDVTDQTKRQLVEALQDFRYNTLRIDFVPTHNDVVTRIQIDGVGRGEPAQKVGPLTLNIGQLNDLVNTGFVDATLRFPQWLEQAMTRLAARSAKEGS